MIMLASAGCQTPNVTCGSGTVLVGDTCVPEAMANADAGPPLPPPPPYMDAGAPPPGVDAGEGWSTIPPGTPPGCDEASGECDAWEAQLLALLEGHPGRGCSTPIAIDPATQAVSDAHAAHQASIDMITATSPSGDLFAQMRAGGAEFMVGGALFSVSRAGAEDIMARWASSPDRAAVLDQCWTIAGVSIATSETGASYTTVLLGRY
ncbi:MAG: CAP domain-containing protein [Sandaracinaceae bacterium]